MISVSLFLNTDNARAAENYSITIMHVNDSHSQVSQYPKLTTAVHSVRAQSPNALLVDAGDVFYGTDYFTKYLGQADLYFMNYLKYDAMALGNHELDKGATVLANFVKGTNFPVLTANVNLTKNSVLAPLFQNQITYNAVGGKIYPAIIKEVNGEKVAFFGLFPTDYTTLNSTYYISAPSTKAQAIVTSLKQQGINKIVLLSHLGYKRDLSLATQVDGIDIIVGGHSHTILSQPVYVKKTEPTVIVQAGTGLSYLGLLNVTFNNSGVVQSYNGKLLTVNNYTANADAQEKLNQINTSGIPAPETAKNGWVTIDGKSYYYVNGVIQTGWQTIGGNNYYFGTDGAMYKGWQTIDGNRYYFGSTTGILKTGFYVVWGKTYYFGDDGVMRTGWQTIDGNTYYFGTNGIMYTGQQTIDGKVYTFNTNGILQS